MSYLVLARKYRPRDFEALVGQQHVVQALSNALTQQRLHHAYLFTGTRGVGKTTVSRILAKALNCTGPDGEGGITAHPCGVCPACRDIDAGRFVDYTELDAASNRGVEEISQLLDQSVYKPVVGRFKVYMIDEVHMLSSHAFNAMLKTLEEPPDYLKFVLATTDPQKLPPTVLSRCLQFNLRPMAPQTVHEHLSAVLAAEHIEADGGSLRLLSRAAHGSMRDALSLTDQAIAFGAGKLEEPVVRQMLGAVDRSHAVRIVEAIAAGNGADLIATVDGLRMLGLSATGTLEEMTALLQQMAVVRAVPDAADAGDPDTPAVQRLSGLLDADEMQLLYSIALHGRADLALSPDEYSGLVMVLLRMLAFMPKQRDASTAANSMSPREALPASGPPVPAATAARADAMAGEGESRLQPQPQLQPQPAQPQPQPQPVTAQAASATPVQASRNVDRRPAAPPMAAAMQGAPATTAPAPGPMLEPPAWLDAMDGDPGADSADAWPSESPRRASPRARVSASDSAAATRPTPTPTATPSPQRPAPQPGSSARAPGANASAPTQRGSTSPVSQPITFERSPEGDRWAELVKQMSDAGLITAMVRELALQAQCLVIDTEAEQALCKIRVERETLRGSSSCEKLQAALGQLLKRNVQLETETGPTEDTPARRDAAARARRQRDAEEAIESDPLVQSLMQQYKSARIVPGSVKPH